MSFNNLKERIKRHEGFRDKVYKCTEGYDTIGYGFAVKDLRLDEDISSIILDRKLSELVERLHSRFRWFQEVPEGKQSVIVEMAYQLGIHGVSLFRKMIERLKDRDWEGASIEMLDSRWARQTPNRAKELSNRMRGE